MTTAISQITAVSASKPLIRRLVITENSRFLAREVRKLGPLGNGGDGILIMGNSTSISTSVIAANGGNGIGVIGGIGSEFRDNSIFDNALLGISLNPDVAVVTPNDPNDGDTGPNNLQNFPVLSVATSTGVILGTLNSVPNTSFIIEFFSSPVCDDSGHGQGQTSLGQVTVNTNALGDAAIVHGVGALTPGSAITATATRNTGTTDTSEFSACVSVDGDDYVFEDGFE